VLHSDEYKAFAEERGRPPPPPEMPRVDKCTEPDRPSQEDEASAAGAFAAIPTIPVKRAATEPDPAGAPGAPPGAGARARSCDVACVAAPTGASPVSPPQSPGEPLLPVIALTIRSDAAIDAANPRYRQGAGEHSCNIFEDSIWRSRCRLLAEILDNDPGLQGSVDWDHAETLGKVRASPKDVITKAKYNKHQIIYSKDRRFPVLDMKGLPPADLDGKRTVTTVLSLEANLT
jgi:hypothetical protein